jgi:hypothetical protein
MPKRPLVAPFALALLASTAMACSAAPGEDLNDDDDLASAYSSSEAVLLDFEFDGTLVTDSTWDLEGAINDQMLYTIGHLNGDRSVGRLDALELSNIKQSKQSDGKTLVTYHAKMPVSWGKKTAIPTSYTFTMPKLGSYSGYQAFTTAYMHTCVEHGAHDVDSGSMWYYYRPSLSGCALKDTDVVKWTATVKVSKLNTTGKYPEYDKVWADGELNVVSVFGKFEDGATSDVGIDGYANYVAAIKNALSTAKITTTPASLPAKVGASTPDVTISATLADGKKVNVTALLVDNVSSAPQSFYDRYNALSTKADLISYNGHAGLGQNVRALAKHGSFVKGQYLIMFMNGCDTFAYVDGSMAETRAAINKDDPTGTKYMDIVTNTMPAFFSSMPGASLAIFKGLLSYASPKTYQQIFDGVDRSQAIVVTGEEDNAFTPGTNPPPPSDGWKGLNESFTVTKAQEKRFSASRLAPGKYAFTLDGTGDADLYVKVGDAPTTKLYDCRPFLGGSKERCEVEVKSTSDVYVMVRGYATSSSVKLVGQKP